MDNLTLGQIYSDMVYSTYEEIKDKKTKTRIDKIIMSLNKYYKNKKTIIINDKFKLAKLEEEYIAKVEEIHKYSQDKEYSMSILCIAMLDYMFNYLDKNEPIVKEFRSKFAQVSTEKILFECEKEHRDLTFNCYKLIKEILWANGKYVINVKKLDQ